MVIKKFNKVWNNFLEFKVKPFILIYLPRLQRFYREFLAPLKSDFNTIFNYYILRKKISPQLIIPSTITLVLSNFCNANCIFCAYKYLNYKKGTMPFEIYRKVVDDFKKIGGTNLMLSPTVGEDLINKDFIEMAEYAKKKNFYISIFTNGILLNKNENYKKIIDVGIDDIFVSTGDIIPKYEAEIFGISQEIAAQKIKGLIKLLEYKEKTKSNVRITIGFRAQRPFRKIWNDMKVLKLKKFFDQKIFHIKFKTCYDNWCGNITKKDLLGIMRLKRGPVLKKYPCSALWSISILPNGDVRLCGCRIKDTEHDGLVIGNVEQDSLIKIIQNEKSRKIFSDWMDGKFNYVCVDCSRYFFPIFLKKRFFNFLD